MPVAIFTLAFLVRAYDISGPSVWTDEAATFFLANSSPVELIRIIRNGDTAPPLAYLIFMSADRLFSGLVGLRLVSAIFSSATAMLVYFLGAKLNSRFAGTLAAMVMIIAPISLALGRQAVYSSIFTFFVVLSTWALVVFLERGRKRYAIFYGLSMLFTAYVHSLFFVLFICHLVVIYIARKKAESIRPLWISFAILLVGFAPWGPSLIHQVTHGAGFSVYPGLRLANLLPLVFVYLTQGWTTWALPVFWQSAVMSQIQFPFPQWIVVLVSVPFMVAVFGGAAVKSNHPFARRAMAVFVILPLLIYLVFAWFRPVFSPLFLLSILPFFAVSCGAFIAHSMSLGKIRGTVFTILILTVFLGGLTEYRLRGGNSENWKGVARFLKAFAQPGDVVLLPNLSAALCMNLYVDDRLRYEFLAFPKSKSSAPIKKEVESKVNNAKRTWLVQYYPKRFPVNDIAHDVLSEVGLEIPFDWLTGKMSLEKRFSLFDQRLKLRLFLTDPGAISEMLHSKIDMSEADSLIDLKVLRGVYKGNGPFRWTSQEAFILVAAGARQEVCVEGVAPSEYYKGGAVQAEFTLKPFPPDDRILTRKQVTLYGNFWVCLTADEYEGPATVELTCDDYFIADDRFKNGDQSPMCLELRRVWVKQAEE